MTNRILNMSMRLALEGGAAESALAEAREAGYDSMVAADSVQADFSTVDVDSHGPTGLVHFSTFGVSLDGAVVVSPGPVGIAPGGSALDALEDVVMPGWLGDLPAEILTLADRVRPA